MRIQLIEHDLEDFSRTNLAFWAAKKGHRVNQTYICNNEKLSAVDSLDGIFSYHLFVFSSFRAFVMNRSFGSRLGRIRGNQWNC